MRIFGIFICLVLMLFEVRAQDDMSLEQALASYQNLEKELATLLKNKIPDCSNGSIESSQSLCSVKEICSRAEIIKNTPYLYQNEKGERVLNEKYYLFRHEVSACLKEKYEDEIQAKKDELIDKLKMNHLKNALAANQKLDSLTKKYNQAQSIQKISTEILKMTLEAQESGDESYWGQQTSTSEGLYAILSKAEKRTKIKLNPEIKKTFVQIQLLKNDDNYDREVAKLEDVLIPEEKSRDPFLNFSLFIDEAAAGGKTALAANRAELQKKAQSAYDLFKETQKDLIAYLVSKKNESNLDKIERMIEKVKTIQFSPPRLTEEYINDCSSPNAYYQSETHTFTICPQLLIMPKISIVETIAHELSHSIDPCDLSKYFYKTKEPSIVAEAPFEVEIKMDPPSGSFTSSKSEMSEGRVEKHLERMRYSDNPFSRTLSCLQDPKSVGVKGISVDEIKKKNEAYLKTLEHMGQNYPQSAAFQYTQFLKENGKDYFDYFQGCNLGDTVSGRSQLEEAFADKMASEVISRKMKNLSRADAEKNFLEVALGYSICEPANRDSQKWKEFAEELQCPSFFKNKTAEDKILTSLSLIDDPIGTHPEDLVRIERNLLANPDIRAALHCPIEKGLKYCE